MLATRELPARYQEWNRRWLAPQGPDGRTCLPISRRVSRRRARALGPFVWQPNSSTRAFEYPWAFDTTDVGHGQRVLEVGGGLSGLQFVLAMAGAEVVNVDPFVSYGGDEGYSQEVVSFHRRLNRLWNTSVSLRPTTIGNADLPSEFFDIVYCISTIEHLEREAILAILQHVRRVLVPGGLFVLTVDLFLNLTPFTDRTHNHWGTNISVAWLLERSGLELEAGDPSQLTGFPDFDPSSILANLERFAIGTAYPQLAQAAVLRKARAAPRRPADLGYHDSSTGATGLARSPTTV